MTDQLNLFIVFYETYGQPERRLCPLVVPYTAAHFLLFGRPVEWGLQRPYIALCKVSG